MAFCAHAHHTSPKAFLRRFHPMSRSLLASTAIASMLPNMQRKRPNSNRKSGFRQTGGLLASRIRGVAETRGFAHTQIITRWTEIVGEETARIAEPVKVTYGNKGIGATLVLLTKGAFGPELEMQKPLIREKVNAIYGYNAIARIHVTQTAATGFADKAEPFAPAPKPQRTADPQKVEESVAPIESDPLREALARLAQNIMSKPSNS